MYRGGNKRYMYCQLKPQVNANRAGGSGGGGGGGGATKILRLQNASRLA